MFLTQSTRRLAAGITAVLLLACQSAALAHFCCEPAPERAPAQELPCHDATPDTGAAGGSLDDRCQQASPASPGISFPAVDELPALTTTARDDRSDAAAAPALPAAPPLLRVDPPPHAILHCCLRN